MGEVIVNTDPSPSFPLPAGWQGFQAYAGKTIVNSVPSFSLVFTFISP